jgi:type II secretory pathway pseudopilin PulG
MADSQVNIRISAQRGDTRALDDFIQRSKDLQSGLTGLQRSIQQTAQQLAALAQQQQAQTQRAQQAQRPPPSQDFNLWRYFQSPQEQAAAQARAQGGFAAWSQRMAGRFPGAAGPGPGPGPGPGLPPGWEAVPGPYGGIRRIGYTGGTGGGYRPPTPPSVLPLPPGGLRPWPAGLPASPFGPAAGGPAGIAVPRPGSPAWLQAQGYVVVPPGTPPGHMPGGGPPPPPPPGGAPAPLPIPPTPPAGGRGGTGLGGALLGGLLGGGGLGSILGGAAGFALGGTPGAVIGAQVGRLGDKAVAAAVSTIHDRAEREVGILQLGNTLNQQYGELRDTMVTMRREYQVLGQEGIQAMMGLARATGQVEKQSTLAAVGVGRVYGLSAAESLETVTAFRLQGVAQPNLAALTAVGGAVAARHPGMIGVPRFIQEATRVGEMGGLAAPPLTEQFRARALDYTAGFGGRYAAQPGAAFAGMGERLAHPTGTLGQVLQVQALDRLRQRQRYINWQGERLDLEDPEDLRVVMENIGTIPEAQEALRQEVVRQGGGSRSLQRFLYGQAGGATATQARREWPGWQEYARQHGGIDIGFQRPIDTTEEQRKIDARKAAEEGTVGKAVLRARTAEEEISELGPMRALLDTELALTNAVGKAAESFNEGRPFLQSLSDGLGELTPLMRDLVGTLKTMQGQGGPLGWITGNVLAVAQGVADLNTTGYGHAVQSWSAGERQKLLDWITWFSGLIQPAAPTTQPRRPQ